MARGIPDLGDAFNTKDIKDKSWISAAEAARAKKSLPDEDNRFLHYRWQAVDSGTKGRRFCCHRKARLMQPCCVMPLVG